MPIQLGVEFLDILRRIWQWLRNLHYVVFYEKPQEIGRKRGLEYHHLATSYHYLKIVAIINWAVPAVGFLVWYIFVVQACRWSWTRGSIEDIYLGFSPQSQVPWYLDLWIPQHTSNSEEISEPALHLERLLTGHKKMLNATRSLDDQASKTAQLAQEWVSNDSLTTLGKSAFWVIPSYIDPYPRQC